ncbi:MAG: SMP-30/gluconolactonase/LRE family protein [Gammaproteobacteria bacterium]
MKALGVFLAAVLAWLLLWPVPIEPVAWDAPEAPALEGIFAPNDALASATRLGEGVGTGPEDVAIDPHGDIFVGYEDGRIVRLDPSGGNPALLANTGGRPLGLDFDGEGRLVIADGSKGLLRLSMSGRLQTLATEAAGVPFGFTNDVDVSPDGPIYFTDASSKFGPVNKARDDLLEHGGHGRLMRYDPATETVTVLLDGLQFANGVAVTPDGEAVLVVQTGAYNVLRYWLEGPKAGTAEMFIANLPGIPDGISCNGRDTCWLALFTTRNAALDALSGWPFLRKLAWRLPQVLQPQPAHHAFVLGLSPEGEVIHNLQDPSPSAFAPITSAEEAQGRLYLGSLEQAAVGVLELAAD